MKIEPDTVLACPACGNENLHQTRIEVFTRRGEDATEGVHVAVAHDVGAPVTMDVNLDDNPSRRRDGILVHFTCEHCFALPILSIAQHKGFTLLDSWAS
jgi:hypothetical protein